MIRLGGQGEPRFLLLVAGRRRVTLLSAVMTLVRLRLGRNRKSPGTPDRPQRMAKIEQAPSRLDVVSRELLVTPRRG